MALLSQILLALLPGLSGLGLLGLPGRWWRRGLVAATIAAQWYLAFTLPLGATGEILGLSLEWSPLGRLFVPLFGLVALALAIQGEGPPYGPHFASLVLFVLTAVSGLLLVEPLVAAPLLVIGGLVGLFAIPQRPKLAASWQAAHRYLTQTFVGGIALILGLLIMKTSGTALAGVPLLRIGVGLLALGFALRLGVIPLHRWLVEMEDHALASAAALILGLINGATLVLLAALVVETPPAVLDPRANQLVLWGGLLSLGLGGLLALGQESPRRLVAFSTTFDLGFILYGLSSVTELGWLGALWAVFHYGPIQLLLHTCLDLAERRRDDGGSASLAGLLGFWGGGFALVGLPPLSPSLGRWMVLTVALRTHWAAGALMLGAAAAVLLAYLRVGHRLFLAPVPSAYSGANDASNLDSRQSKNEPATARFVVGLVLAAMAALTFYPSAILTLMQQALRGFPFPSP